ncbi:MAG: polysaccharide biosynthesis protein [bacterium]|nr:polysaccharide biosynthesis protein [bacterium]
MFNRFQRLSRISSRDRALLVGSVDAVITVLSFLAALWLRFSGTELAQRLDNDLLQVMAILIACRLLANYTFRLHLWSFRFSGLADGARIGIAGVSGTALFVFLLYLLKPLELPQLGRAVLVLELLLSTTLMAAVRFAPRLGITYRADLLRGRRPDAVATAIVGAGSAGEMLLRGLLRSEDHDYRIVGFIDDDRARRGHVVGGKSVLGGVADLPELVERYRIRQILIAIPNLSARRVREILELSTHLQLRFKILSVSYQELEEKSASSLLEDLTPRDLLNREEVTFKQGREASFLGGGQQMVVGAAGSIGSEVCAQLLEAGARRLVMLDIDENGLYMLKRRLERRYPDSVVVAEIADIRDTSRIEVLFGQHRPVDVFHAAARKQVPLMEAAPGESVKTNVLGTLHLARVAAEYGAERFVYMSTDKAVKSVSVMGASKRLGEMVVRRMDESSKTRFSVVRFGNVFDSAGSVVPLFREQIQGGGPVTVTHPDVRRYFMTISEAVGLVLRAAYGDYGRLCVLDMGEPIAIADLARLMITLSGRVPNVDVKITYTGLRPGEKLDEELWGEGETTTRRIDSRICVVESPAPDGNLLAEVEQLRLAVAAEDQETVRSVLRQLVADYRPLGPTDPEGAWLAEDSAVM